MDIAVDHAQLHDTGHFLAKANTTGAMNTTAHLFHRDQRTNILVEDNVLFFLEA